MEQQSNDNFNKLFRKVADNYPLNTNNKNWDNVAARLNEQKQIAKTKSNKKWQLAILLLLITAGSFGIYLYSVNAVGTKTLSKNTAVKSASEQQQTKQNISNLNTNNKNNIKNDVTESIQATSLNNQNPISNSAWQNVKSNNSNNDVLNETNPSAKTFSSSANQFQPFQSETNFQLAEIAKSNNNYHLDLIAKSLDQTAKQFLFEQKQLVQNNNINQQKKSTHIKLNAKPSAFFYGSFFVSPDFSTVKFQKVNEPGLKIGVQLGYKISNSFSAEINLIRYHSDFYSLGKYFSATGLKLKPNTTVEKVYGKTKMTEAPFDIRYNLPKTNNHFFITAGTSLALITHTEKYNYDVVRGNGVNASASKKFSSVSGTKEFSNINVSAGYEAPVVHSIKIKAEPYYQIPLKKFGIGNLPVTHFGVNIGIVKDLK